MSPEDYEMASLYKWHLTSNGYARRRNPNRGEFVYMHRAIGTPPPGMWIDHIDHNKLNNTRENLRAVTPRQSRHNSLKTVNQRSSRFKGVSFKRHRDVWEAYITEGRKKSGLGFFKTELEAASAYNARAIELWGAYAKLNQLHAI